jgi:hypothetical protein
MSYDFKILAVKSKDIYHVNFQSSIEVMNELEDGFNRYKDIWTYMTNTEGIWYSLIKEHDGLYDAYEICDSNFEIEEKDIEMPYWIKDENIRYDLTPLIIKKDLRVDFQNIIGSLINTSPIKTIMLLASYQSNDKEIVCGVLSLNEYFTLLDEGKILFNVCYIISG